MKLYVIITLLVVLLMILFYTVYYEGYENPKPITEDSPTRVNFTCSDTDQTNVFDRFNYFQIADSNNRCITNYTKLNNYFGLSNICLPNCPSGFTLSPVDNTLCVANSCHNSADLSQNILGSWYNTCSVMYKQQYKLTSTITSISNVTKSFNNQFRTIKTEYDGLNMTVNSINCSLPANSAKCAIRDRHMNDIGSNYNNLLDITSNINYNYNYLSNRKNSYDSVYYDLLCDRYI